MLFDIDGTLVDTEGAGLESLKGGLYSAFPDCVGREFPPLDLGGATDGSVVAFLFAHFSIEDTEGNRDLFFESYSSCLDETLVSFRENGKGRALPGVSDSLKVLQEMVTVPMGLLTGNIESGARIKLRHFGLDGYFRFGAFGDDHHDRNELGPIAMERAKKETGQDFAPEETAIIGDTLKDIACARACGAKAIAVATGTVSREALLAAEPDLFFDDLSEPGEVLLAIEAVFPA